MSFEKKFIREPLSNRLRWIIMAAILLVTAIIITVAVYLSLTLNNTLEKGEAHEELEHPTEKQETTLTPDEPINATAVKELEARRLWAAKRYSTVAQKADILLDERDCVRIAMDDRYIIYRICSRSYYRERNQTYPPHRRGKTAAECWKEIDSFDILGENVTATMFSGVNYTGDLEEYDMKASDFPGGCHNLGPLSGNVSSIETYGKCVRLFEGTECTGWSTAVYPGSENSHSVLNEYLTSVRSVGDCLTNELHYRVFKDPLKTKVWKPFTDFAHCNVPDMIEFGHPKRSPGATLPSPSDGYVLGRHGRVEFLRTWIYARDLFGSKPSFKYPEHNRTGTLQDLFLRCERVNFITLLGFGIDKLLSGSGANEWFHTVELNTHSRKQWYIMTSGISQHLEKHASNVVLLQLHFEYDKILAYVADAITYHISYYGTGFNKISDGVTCTGCDLSS